VQTIDVKGKSDMSDVKTVYDICIIGAGASGMAAAVTVKMNDPAKSVLVIEKMGVPGKKIRATGSGRCNLTNTGAAGYLRTLAFFESVGLATRTYENGLIYPYSETAADVADILSDRMTELGAELLTDAAVTDVRRVPGDDGAGFVITVSKRDDDGITSDMTMRAGRVILAMGGKAGPNYGTTGDGYAIARSLGHSVVKPAPALTPVECAYDEMQRIAGIRAKGIVKLYLDNTETASESGEIQFTKNGLSGICVLDLTRHMRFEGGRGIDHFEIGLDLCPGPDIGPFLRSRVEKAIRAESDETARTVLRSVIRMPLAEYVVRRAGIAADMRISMLDEEDIARLEETVHDLRFTPSKLMGWKEAQVTSGGVSLDEIDPATCESKLVKGLYITGELADYDGPCGGYNLNNAWLTGIAAGESVIKG
jgi:predicted Rossmann fold flavoprotein